jgi:hypothetical protein
MDNVIFRQRDSPAALPETLVTFELALCELFYQRAGRMQKQFCPDLAEPPRSGGTYGPKKTVQATKLKTQWLQWPHGG